MIELLTLTQIKKYLQNHLQINLKDKKYDLIIKIKMIKTSKMKICMKKIQKTQSLIK